MDINNIEVNVLDGLKFTGIETDPLPTAKHVREFTHNAFGWLVSDPPVYWAKSSYTAKIPTKTEDNAGYDFYADTEFEITIEPHTSKLINTNVRCAIPKGYMMLLEERGSTGSIGIKRSAGVIDSNFRGNIQVVLYNSTDKRMLLSPNADKVEVYAGDIIYPTSKAIAQGLILPVPTFRHVEVPLEDFMQMETDRGEGMLGSSGK